MSEHKVEVNRLKAKNKGHIQSQALPSAGTQWLSRNIHPKHTPCAIRISVAVTVPGVLSVLVTNRGDTQTVDLNEGDPLVPDALYIFEFMVHRHDRINFSYDTTNGIIRVLRLEEIDSSVAVGQTGTSN